MARTYTKESKPRPAEMQAGASWNYIWNGKQLCHVRVVTAYLDGAGLHVRTIGMCLVGIEVGSPLVSLVEVRTLLIVIHYHILLIVVVMGLVTCHCWHCECDCHHHGCDHFIQIIGATVQSYGDSVGFENENPDSVIPESLNFRRDFQRLSLYLYLDLIVFVKWTIS